MDLEVKALVSKARLARAYSEMCGHDWVFDHPSQVSRFMTFYGSSVCRICGERRENSRLMYGAESVRVENV